MSNESTTAELLTAAEVAIWLRISTTAVYAMCDAGKLKCHRIGLGTKRQRIRIARSAVESYLAGTETSAPDTISIPLHQTNERKRRITTAASEDGFALLRAAGWKG